MPVPGCIDVLPGYTARTSRLLPALKLWLTEMKTDMFRPLTRWIMLAVCSALAGSCAITQPSPPADEQVLSTITIAEAQQDPRLPESDGTGQAPGTSSATGELPVVRWGGTIASLFNQDTGNTLVEIVSRPLQGSGRPLHNDRSQGRFLAEVDGFLDPEIVKPGRDMTVVGPLTRRQRGSIGETPYVFPVVSVEDFRYWEREVHVPTPHFRHWNAYTPFGYYDPFWDDWPFPPPVRRPR